MSDWRPIEGELAGWTRGEGPRLVFVHGFTQTSSSWKPVAERFAADGYEAVVIDAPGHGGSADVRVDLPRAAQLLTSMCGSAVYVGYSMGGRLCLHAALAQARAVRGLALVSASPGIADARERHRRQVADEQLAAHLEAIGVAAFLDEWLAQPLFAGLQPAEDQRVDRMRNTSDGLASSLRMAGAGAQASLWPRLATLTTPVLAIAGERDTKYTEIARLIAAALVAGRFETIAGAGHAAHLQAPDQVADVLSAWLGEVGW